MTLHNTTCPICGKRDNDVVVFEANFKPEDFNVEVFSARRLPDKIHYRIVRCKHDGLLRSDPVTSSDQLFDLYKKSRFTYDGEVSNLIITYMHALRPALEHIKKDDAILEIGCGNGFILNELHKEGYTNVWGAEPSTDAIKKANPSIRNKIKPSVFNAKLFKKNSLKCIFMFQTLDHIPNPSEFLQDVYDALEPGGYFFSFQHNADSFSANLLKEKSPIFDIEHTCLYDSTTLRKLCERNGLLSTRIASEWNLVSLKHIVWLLPIPKNIKLKLLKQKGPLNFILQHVAVPLRLGNISILAYKQ